MECGLQVKITASTGRKTERLALVLAADQHEGMPVLCLCIVSVGSMPPNLVPMNFSE